MKIKAISCIATLCIGLISFVSSGTMDLVNAEEPNIPDTYQNLDTLNFTEVKVNDVYKVAEKYQGIVVDPTVPAREKVAYALGDTRDFYVLDITNDEYSQVEARLAYITDHLYFWVQEGIEYDQDDLALLCDTFEEQIYPLNREFFGSEDTPGIDNDEHLYILYSDQMGGAAGYFSSGDANPQEIDPYSNEAEIFMLSSIYNRLDLDYTYGVLAHEFQHMIHQNMDINESTWVNEGFSELASFLNGFDPGSTDQLYARFTDIQLNYWPRQEEESPLPHYGASYLFMAYLYEQMGTSFTKALVANPLDGFKALDANLAILSWLDHSNQLQNSDDIFQNWTVANILQDASLSEGQYGYTEVQEVPQFTITHQLDCNALEDLELQVHQYGVDYYELTCDEPFQVTFEGESSVEIVPADPNSGDMYFWSNKGDQSSMTLTQKFDFRKVQGPISIRFHTWYDLESDWDYVYLLASEDGETWRMLDTPNCTMEDPTGNNQGCGYTGRSDGWILEEVDLSDYAGEEVTLQFEYLTDAALNGEGFLIDDVSIAAIDYETDFESGDGGWQPDGFVRISNKLPQTYRISLIQQNQNGTDISHFGIDDNAPSLVLSDLDPNARTILVISGTTRYTHIQADYSIRLERLE